MTGDNDDMDRVDEVRILIADELQTFLNVENEGRKVQVNVGACGDKVRLSIGTGAEETFVVIYPGQDEQLIRDLVRKLLRGEGTPVWLTMSAVVRTSTNG